MLVKSRYVYCLNKRVYFEISQLFANVFLWQKGVSRHSYSLLTCLFWQKGASEDTLYLFH